MNRFTDFEDGDRFSDLMEGDVADVRGKLDTDDHHVIRVDKVEIEGL